MTTPDQPTDTTPALNVRHVCVPDEAGLHARPAAKVAGVAQRFAARIEFHVGEHCADAKSILDILGLAAGEGCSIEIRADGEDAVEALDTLERLFHSKFREE